MTVNRLDSTEVSALVVRMLGLDETLDLFSQEGLCASLRRAASFLCPASPRRLVDAVLDTLIPLGGEPPITRDDLMEYLDLLVGAGDLLELKQSGEQTIRQIYLGPPSYVEKQAGQYLLLGVRPYAAPLIDVDAMGAEIVYDGHTRTVLLDPSEADNTLADAGLLRMTAEQWIKAPRTEPYSAALDVIRERLELDRVPGHINDLKIIDSSRSVRFYRDRWRSPVTTDTGIAVGRRPQAYGAPIWCGVLFDTGIPQAVVDLPIESTTAPGWDEARRLQAALDAERGTPQQYRVHGGGVSGGTQVIDLFAPLPTWAERYLELVGLPVPKTRGALFSYRVPDAVVRDVEGFLGESLWMTATDGEVQRR
jgi:hypothetical protein